MHMQKKLYNFSQISNSYQSDIIGEVEIRETFYNLRPVAISSAFIGTLKMSEWWSRDFSAILLR